MFYCGEKLWKNSKNSFNEHKKYFSTVIRKPFSMSIVEFNDRMREYAHILSFLQPPTRKGSKGSSDADWKALKRISQEDIRVATFDALPVEYRNYIESQYEKD